MNELYYPVSQLMSQYPVKKLQPRGPEHAEYALKQALVDGYITRTQYDDVLSYVRNGPFVQDNANYPNPLDA